MGIYENEIPGKNSSKGLSTLFCSKKHSENVSSGDIRPINATKKWKTKRKKSNDNAGKINGVTEGIYENQIPDKKFSKSLSDLLNSKKHSRNVSLGNIQPRNPKKKSKDKKKASSNNLGTEGICSNQMPDKSNSMCLLEPFDSKEDLKPKITRSRTITVKEKGFLQKKKNYIKSKFSKEKTSDCLAKNIEEIPTNKGLKFAENNFRCPEFIDLDREYLKIYRKLATEILKYNA